MYSMASNERMKTRPPMIPPTIAPIRIWRVVVAPMIGVPEVVDVDGELVAELVTLEGLDGEVVEELEIGSEVVPELWIAAATDILALPVGVAVMVV